MGRHGNSLPAAIGAKKARPDRPVLCLTGDGGRMMCVQDPHTTAERDLDITVVIFDKADYGVISKSPRIQEYAEGHRFSWRSPDFV
ncbi:thiamine pyrophosphate-dependent enzyme [Halorarum salinum]|uniref:thiamine pyrophosphate-dependent enzyme n=1 Tax=Halorarum salinum TaxID=2743089 RepID=UPI001C52EC26